MDVTGTHTVVVADSGGNESGDYEMLLQRRNPMADTEAINYGDDVTRTISPFVDLDGYTFSGTLGDQLWIRMKPLTGGIEAALWVLRPDGTTLCSQAASGGNSGLLTLDVADGCTLDVTGTHTVVVADSGFGNESGDYEMLLQRRNPMADTEAINYGG